MRYSKYGPWKSWFSNQRNYGQNKNWTSGLKQHTNQLWNLQKLYSNKDLTPCARNCDGLCHHSTHEQFFAGSGCRAVRRKLIMSRKTEILKEKMTECSLKLLPKCLSINKVASNPNLVITERALQIIDPESCCGSFYWRSGGRPRAPPRRRRPLSWLRRS